VSTKYAKARDVAGQWKSELRKVQRENRSLRKVYAAANLLLDELAIHRQHTGSAEPIYVMQAAKALRTVMRSAVFAELAAAAIGNKLEKSDE
jgi:hypothetical protein